MRAWHVTTPGPIDTRPLELRETEPPVAGDGELLLRIRVCGVCRTDLHLAEGDLPPRRPDVTPGHEVVGEVVALGPGATRFAVGERVGVAWLPVDRRYLPVLPSRQENLCPASTTRLGSRRRLRRVHAVPAAFAHHLPDNFDDEQLAPLLCAGIIGYRALNRAEVPPGGVLGLYGFGGSAHLTAQVAMARGARGARDHAGFAVAGTGP